MALRDLSAAEMLSLSKFWLAPDKERALLEKYSLTAAMLSKIEEVHEALMQTQVNNRRLTQRSKELQAEASALDSMHDRKARGLHQLLTAAVTGTDDEAERERYLMTQEDLYPRGMKVVGLSHREEAGEVELLEERVTSQHRSILGDLKMGTLTGVDLLDAWIVAGKKLGEVQNERDLLAKRGDTDAIQFAEAFTERMRWIRVVNTLLQTVKLEPFSDDERTLLFASLEQTRRKSSNVEAEPSDPKEDSDSAEEPKDES